MKSVNNYNISFEDRSLRAKVIVAARSEITYARALAQVERLRKTSKVSQSSKKNNQYN